MPMVRRAILRIVAVVLMAVGIAGCGESYRYKLTLAVNTPEGVRRASSIIEVDFWSISFPEKGLMHSLRGEALYLDLGPGRKPLIALLTCQLHPKYRSELRWTRDGGPDNNLLLNLFGRGPPSLLDNVARIAQMRGSHQITPSDLPDLVTFADVNDPASVLEVDPNNLQATLGSNIAWDEITLESTGEPITTGLAQRLPWLPAYSQNNWRLDGSNHHFARALANTLSWFDFVSPAI